MTLPTESECKNATNPSLWMRFNCWTHRVLDAYPHAPIVFGLGASALAYKLIKKGRER